jgi:hypothetical protein
MRKRQRKRRRKRERSGTAIVRRRIEDGKRCLGSPDESSTRRQRVAISRRLQEAPRNLRALALLLADALPYRPTSARSRIAVHIESVAQHAMAHFRIRERCSNDDIPGLTPQERGDWYADLGYGTSAQRSSR